MLINWAKIGGYLASTDRTAFLLKCLVVLVGAGLGLWLTLAWRLEGRQPIVCLREMPDSSAANSASFILELQSQDPVEPIFPGQAYLSMRRVTDTTLDSIRIEYQGAAGYAVHVGKFPIRLSEDKRFYNTRAWTPFSVESYTRSHRQFPFDSPAIVFTLKTDDKVKVDRVRIYNRVRGMQLLCPTFGVTRSTDNTVEVRFRMRRSLMVQTAGILLLASAAMFCLLILAWKTKEHPGSQATAVASYFFSIWSVRSILATEIKVFPTVLDYWLLMFSLVLLLGLLWKVIPRASKE